ncbi:MAG: hypothetical protein U0905_22785 [Pirellulales bacterium]
MHDEDADDIHQPLLVWWALESHLRQADQSILMQAMLPTNDAWNSKMMQNTLLERWMKRYSQSGRREDLLDAAKLLAAAPNAESSTKIASRLRRCLSRKISFYRSSRVANSD